MSDARPKGTLTPVGDVLRRVVPNAGAPVTHADVNALIGPIYGPGITEADHRNRGAARARLSPERVAYWFGVIGDRLGRRLESPTAREYYYALAERLTTPEFERGAAAIFGSELYAQWPSVQAFVDEARADVDERAGPTVEATAPLLAAYAAEREQPAPDAAALEDFAHEWRAKLAHCAPDRLRTDRRRARGDDRWLTDESRAALRPPVAPVAAPAPARPPASAPVASAPADDFTAPLDPTDAIAV